MIFSGFGLATFSSEESDSGPNSRNFPLYDRDVYVDTITVNDYFIVPGIFASKHYPGQQVNLTTQVWNLGTKSIATPFDILMVILDDINEVDVSYEVHLKQTIKAMPSRSSTNLSWTWTPPAVPPANANWDYTSGNGHPFKCRVISLFDGDQNSSNNFNSSRIDIDNPKFEPQITNRVWGDYGVSDTPLLQIIPIGSILYLNFTVNNTASSQDFIKVEVYDLPPDWVVLPGSLPDFLQLGGTKGTDVRLRLQISRNNSLALKAHDYKVNIRAYSLFSPPKNHTFQFTVNLKYSPLAKFILPKDITLQPGSHLIDVTLQNIGNGRDIFEVTSEVFPAEDPSRVQWKTTVYSGKKTKLLKTFETTTVTLRVDVPEKRKDSYKTIIVTAHSVQYPTYNTDDEYRFKIYVAQFHGVGLRLSDDVETPLSMTPSDEYSFEMILTNRGNTKDPTIMLDVIDRPEGWEITLETSNVPKSGLGIGADVDVGVLINTPSHVLMGEYKVTIAGKAGNPMKVYSTIEIPVVIIEVGNVQAQANPLTRSGNIGDIVQYKIFVKNIGNRLDTFDISMDELTEGMHGWGKLSQKAVTLEANASYEIVLTVTIPLNASADTNPNTPSIWEGYTIQVNVRSQNLSKVARSVQVTTNVNQFYDFDLSADSNIKPVIRGINEPVPFFLRVNNRGNVKDTFEFTLDSKYKWGRVLTKYKTVKPGETQDVKFEANPPDNIGVGVYEFEIIVTSQGDWEKFREINLKVFVSSLELSINKILVDGDEQISDNPVETNGGNTVLVTAQIKNTGTVTYDNLTFPELQVVFFDGKTTIGKQTLTYLPLQGITNISVTWNTTLVTQDLTIYVNLDPNEDVPFSNRENLSMTSKVHVQGPIEVKDVGSEGPGLDQYLLPIMIILFLIIVQLLAIIKITQVKKSRVKSGYTADGEYRPFADVFDPFAEGKQLQGADEDHPYRVAGAGELDKVSITAPDRPMLPPSTHAANLTRPVVKTRPLPRTAPVKRRRK
jgi:uncharacterized membrane protein